MISARLVEMRSVEFYSIQMADSEDYLSTAVELAQLIKGKRPPYALVFHTYQDSHISKPSTSSSQ